MAEGSEPVKQDVVEELLRQADEAAPTSSAGSSSASAGSPNLASRDNQVLRPDEIEALLKQNESGSSARSAAAGPAPPLAASAPSAKRPTRAFGASGQQTSGGEPRSGHIAQGDIDFLLNQAEQALASVQNPGHDDLAASAVPFRLTDFTGAAPTTENATLDLIRDVDLDLRIELGRTHMHLEDVLKLGKGAVVPLDKLAGDPVDIYANGRLIARGEVLILNDNFCVRVAELVAGESAASAH
jgi:flagellar motor switch protein FliN/FliY